MFGKGKSGTSHTRPLFQICTLKEKHFNIMIFILMLAIYFLIVLLVCIMFSPFMIISIDEIQCPEFNSIAFRICITLFTRSNAT